MQFFTRQTSLIPNIFAYHITKFIYTFVKKVLLVKFLAMIDEAIFARSLSMIDEIIFLRSLSMIDETIFCEVYLR